MDKPVINDASEGGATGTHLEIPAQTGLLAPATGAEGNRLAMWLIPIACWRVDDLRFEFGSSFVRPELAEDLSQLSDLRDLHKQKIPPVGPNTPTFLFPPLAIFGHADPIGSDDYNKQLSGRRVRAIYALLTRDTGIWDELFSKPQGDDQWGPKSIAIMQDTLGQPLTGEADGAARKRLFLDYMDKLCGKDFKLDKTDGFLARGKDSGGKGDYQGCSEFNPEVLFSKEEETEFAREDNKEERDTANAPNRRVIVLLFRPGSQVDPARWPCPRASEGVAGCKKRFWADGDTRRSTHLAGEGREFKTSKDTHACRFYDRLAGGSPCEGLLAAYRIRLFDFSATPLPFAPFVAEAGQVTRIGRADQEAFITVRDLKVPTTCTVKWNRPGPGDNESSPAPKATETFEFELSIFVEVPEEDDTQASDERLHNLAYVEGPAREDNVREFQRDYKDKFPQLKVSGNLDPDTIKILKQVHDSCDPVKKKF